mgnify:CR=1 FL=1
MNENDRPQDDAAAKELDGVPEEFLDNDGESGKTGEAENSAEAELAALREELEEAKQQVLYAKADTQNVRRRMEKDIADARAYAATGFARDVLSVADNLKRAIDAVPTDLREDDKFKGLVAGIEATQRELDKIFTQHGIARIEAMGQPLDPNRHQAMIEMPHSEAEPGTIVQEMQAGYTIGERLLRPALVGVAKRPD